jgi:hypothetical protein
MRSIYVYAGKEYPYAAKDEGMMDAAESILYSINELHKREHYIKQLLDKTSLTVEQKLTYIALLFIVPDETIREYGAHDYEHDPVFDALVSERWEVIDTLK